MAEETKNATPDKGTPIVPGDIAPENVTPSGADKAAPTSEERQTTEAAPNVTVYKMEDIKAQREAAAKGPEAGAPEHNGKGKAAATHDER